MVAFSIWILETIDMASPIRPVVCITLFALLAFPLASSGQKSKKLYGLRYSLFKGQAAPSWNLVDSLSREAHWDEESGSLNPDNLRLRFEKIDEQAQPGGLFTDRYRVFADGAPENKVFVFGSWPINQEFAYDPRDIYVNGQGLLMIHKPTPDQEMSLKLPGDELVVSTTTATAEPVRYLFARRDHELLIPATLVSHPVKAEENGCRLEARLAASDASSVLILAEGVPEKAKIPLVLESGNLSITLEMDTDQDGKAVVAAFPFIPGKPQGILRATAEGPGCLPTLVLPWGPAAPATAKSEASAKKKR